ncbi:MAG: hypothetical protein C4520_13275 [Candidatus Abyssobacteria bacterium SURF_5]|uniref:Uncharacterized protein n=1 Tax=Abyssobacteria bacterium (strain SURF_5) TaxID=2093360 RepID=A0A3A4NM54_ABYX5|nr:MAG: hypothetical protein C4520_13275 [Candidatus Abyssubacteria bacterium SURF_5]
MTRKRRIGQMVKIRFMEDPLPKGYVYPCTIEDIKQKLNSLAPEMLRNISTIHLCNQVKMNPGVDAHIYDGSDIRIYPVPEKLRWYYGKRKPNPACAQERLEFGAYWQTTDEGWFLCWDRDNLREYILNHILLHEIGHSLDTVYYGTSRGERFAEAFAHHVGKNQEIKRTAKKRKKRLRRYRA